MRYLFLFLFVGSLNFLFSEEAQQKIDQTPPPVQEPPPQSPPPNCKRDYQDYLDPAVIRDYIGNNRLIECKKKDGKLTFSGDVRARWIWLKETKDKFEDEGEKNPFKKGRGNNFKSEVNIFLDYDAPCTWFTSKIRWSSSCGTDGGGGGTAKTDIDRAFIGYDFFEKGKEDFYVEVGRSRLSYMFESRVEFASLFDGLHLYYTNSWPAFGTFTMHGGPFIIDSHTNHYGWVVELAIKEWWKTGFGFKYSIIDWDHAGKTKYYGKSKEHSGFIKKNPRYRFLVSQMLFSYETKLDFLKCKTLYAYAAVLANHDAKATATSDWKRLNNAWYAGVTLGRLCKACDWSLDINYQSVQMQAIPEFDLAGIGHGNADDELFSDALLKCCHCRCARGPLNYKGWQGIWMYALSDSLSIRSIAQYSTPRNRSVGGDFNFMSFELAAIYAF